MKSSAFRLLVAALLAAAGSIQACDICAIHVSQVPHDSPETFTASVFEQYSKYDASPGGGDEFESYTTQFNASYRLSDTWWLQAGIPYLDRDLDGDTESGPGDATLLGIYRVVSSTSDSGSVQLDVYAGIKVPTGNTDPLKEEKEAAEADHDDEDHEHAGLNETPVGHGVEEHGDEEADEGHHAEGHHLTLGSGSWDGLVGVRGVKRQNRWVGLAELQYSARTEGDHDYQFGNELILKAGGRFQIVQNPGASVAIGLDVTREWRDDNEVLGMEQDESAKSASYIGPVVEVTAGSRLMAAASWDLAFEGEDEGLSGAADTRVRASLTFLF